MMIALIGFRSIQLRPEAFERCLLVTPLWKWAVNEPSPDPVSVVTEKGLMSTRLNVLYIYSRKFTKYLNGAQSLLNILYIFFFFA